MNFCKDCKHWDVNPLSPYKFCVHPGAVRDPETGIAFSEFERSAIGNCGNEGKLFEPKPVKITWLKRIFG